MFKAKDRRKETAGAAEVEEDRRVRVDLPIDQVKTTLWTNTHREQSAPTR